MEPEYLARLTDVEARSRSNTHRLDKLEDTVTVVHELATSVAVMAKTQEQQTKALEGLQKTVEEIKAVPARRWEQVVEKVIFGLVGTGLGVIVTFVVSKLVGA